MSSKKLNKNEKNSMGLYKYPHLVFTKRTKLMHYSSNKFKRECFGFIKHLYIEPRI